jgi:uncharacterized protein (DUF58 family)
MQHQRLSYKPPRSRIQFGSGGMMFIIVSLLILSVALYTNSPLLYGAFGLMIGALCISTIVSWQMMRGITVQRILPSHGVAGESTAIRYQIVNHKRFMPVFSLVVRETWGRGSNGWRKSGPLVDDPIKLKGLPHGWVLHLGPNQRVQAEAPCWPIRRGALRFEKIQVYTSFPFGVIRRMLEFEQTSQMLVYPQLFRINRHVLYRLSDADPHGRKKLEKAGGNEEFFGLREYRAGDSLKVVDWKRTARAGKLISREMTQPSPPKITMVLDLTFDESKLAGNGDAGGMLGGLFGKGKKKKQFTLAQQQAMLHERCICLAASMACDAYLHGYQIGMSVIGVPSVPFPVHHSLPHRTRMLEALSQLDLKYLDNSLSSTSSLSAVPSVVIQCSEHGNVPAGPQTQILRADEMQSFVLEFEDGSASVLNKQVTVKTKRQEIGKAGA